MEAPRFPHNEKQRLEAIDEYNILDTLPEKEFDNITKLASEICQTPVSLITILDPKRNWFKSHHGIDFNESPREISFCGHAILQPADIMIVPNTKLDPRFVDNPNVVDYNVSFYAGVPLTNPEGFPLGTLCIMDFVPRELEERQIESLRVLANQATNLFELKRSNIRLERKQAELEQQNYNLEQFAMVVSHDLKSPLSNISGLTDLLRMNYLDQFDKDGKEILNYLDKSSLKLKNLIDGILEHYKSTKILSEGKDNYQLPELIGQTIDLLNVNNEHEINYPKEEIELYINKTSFQQILINLLGNSIKYNNKEKTIIDIKFDQDDTFYVFSVQDNGPGIEKDYQDKVFEIFNNLGRKDRHNNSGNGIGLSTVKNLVEGHGGSIRVNPDAKQGTLIEFKLKK